MTNITKKQLKMKILDSKLGKSIPLPSYSTKGSAGLDLHACIDQSIIIKPGFTVMIPTGIAVYIEDVYYCGLLLPRSGLGHNHGIVLSNSIGLIDSDYQGELKISCYNRSDNEYTIKIGERLAQYVLVPVMRAQFEIVTEFEETERAEGGFGHTGR